MKRVTPASALIVFAACGGGHDPGATETRGEEVINGSVTEDRPEIGHVHLSNGTACTATLIRPNVAITAAHCVGYGSTNQAANYGQLGVDVTLFDTRWYTVELYHSFGRTTGARDVALLRLANAVPAEVATPAVLSEGAPRSGEDVTIWGYGCTDRVTGEGEFRKRRLTAAFGGSSNLCPGDSGGPVVFGSDGPIFRINSAYYVTSGDDVFATPYAFLDEIRAKVDEWAGPESSEPPPAPMCLGDATSGALKAVEGTEVAGTVCPDRDTWLAVALEAGQKIDLRVSFVHSAGDIDLELFDPAGQQVAKSDGTADTEAIVHIASAAGLHPFRVFGYQGATNGVKIEIALSGGGDSDGDGDGVPDATDRCTQTPSGQRVWTNGQWIGCAGGEHPDR